MKVIATNRSILRLAFPILIALLIPQISYLANAVFLGHYGEAELRVIGVAGVFYLALSMVGYGLSNGMQILMARRAGEQDPEGVTRTLSTGLLLSVGVSISMILVALVFAPLIFGTSLRDSENIRLSVSFLYQRVWGLPFLMLSQLFNAFFIAIQRSRFLIYGALAGTATNIILDYFLIFGYGPFPEIGLKGAALASVLAEVVTCIIMCTVYFFNRFQVTYPFQKHLYLNRKLAGNSLKIATPLILQYIFSIGGWQIFFIYVEHLGNKELAASQILRSMFGMIWVGIWAFAAASNTMVSNIIGQGKSRLVSYLTWKIARMSLIYAAAVCLPVFLFSRDLVSAFRNDPFLVEFAQPALHVVLISTLVMSVSTVVFNAVVGTGSTLINMTIEIFCVVLYVLYCNIVIERMRLSLSWAWGSEFVYWSSLLLISFIFLRSGKWRGKNI